jgi:hypothetical protein
MLENFYHVTTINMNKGIIMTKLASKILEFSEDTDTKLKGIKDKMKDIRKDIEAVETKKRALNYGIEVNNTNLQKAIDSKNAKAVTSWKEAIARDTKAKKELLDQIAYLKRILSDKRTEIKRIKGKF